MLVALRIEDLAIVDRADVEFSRGFTVITGETGAGKSILVGALRLLLGGRVSRQAVRTGCQRARVEASFDISGCPWIRERLRARELIGDDVDSLVIRRELSTTGRGKVLVNDRLTTVAALQEVTQGLVNISGQHDQTSLRHADNHIDLLDSWTEAQELRGEYAQSLSRYRAIERRLGEIHAKRRDTQRALDFARFELGEINELSPQPSELADLGIEERLLAGAERLGSGLGMVESALYSAEGAVVERLGRAAATLRELAEIDDGLGELADTVEGAVCEVTEVARDVGSRMHTVDVDPERLDEVGSRIAELRRLCRKHGESIEDVLRRRDELDAEVSKLSGESQKGEELVAELAAVRAETIKKGLALRDLRKTAAPKFAAAVEAELADMEMPAARFCVQVLPAPGDDSANGLAGASRTGMDTVGIAWSANAGEELRPIEKTASGGELSRLMLAIRHVLSSGDRVALYVFDEVDTGLGGRAAEAIGRKIQDVADQTQSIAITHLAPIAARADHQFEVSKSDDIDGSGRTSSQITPISGKRRRAELARMIGGDDGAQALLKAADELLRRAKSRPR